MLKTCCKKLLKEPMFVVEDNKVKISGKLVFHLYDTHGVPLEVTEYVFSRKLL